MSELKTLNGVMDEWVGLGYGDLEIINSIRQEAIKWINRCEICKTARPIKICFKHKELARFINLREEDLEDEKNNTKTS